MKREEFFASYLYLIFFFLLLLVPQKHVKSSITHADILAHIIGFFLFYFVLNRGLGIKRSFSLCITLLVSLFTESVQYFIPWRDFSLIDLLSDIIGTSAGFLLSMKSGLLEDIISTFGFIGYIKIGPGTIASFITTLFIWLVRPSFMFILEGLVLILFSGILSSSLFAKKSMSNDPKEVVIDEVSGVLTAFLFLKQVKPLGLLLAFVFFRLYDIIKPFGIKKVEKIPGGSGIMLDDEVAGIYAGFSTVLLMFFLKKGGIL